jgi:hypothetical protein
MEIYDLGIAWNCVEDADFVKELNDCALKEGLRPYLIHAYNFYGTLKDIVENHIYILLFLDRTVNDGTPLCEVGDFLKRKSIVFINYPDRIQKLVNRYKIYLEPVAYNISLPARMLLKPQDNRHIMELKIKYLSNPFVLKPVDGLYTAGINLDAKSIDDILRIREQYGNVTYVAQEKIDPIILDKRRASFRNIYCLGEVIPSWWHPQDNVYEILTQNDIDKFKLDRLLSISKEIARVSKLDFFLTEVVIDKKSNFFVTDQINIHPEIRQKSKFNDGMPDEIVKKIIKNIIYFAKQKAQINAI